MTITINDTQYNIQVAPVLSETLNETFDTFTCVLPYNYQETPFEPQSVVKLYDDDNNIVGKFVLTSDEVEIVDRQKKMYKHTLNCTEYIEVLNKKFVKDMKFSQPPKAKKIDFCATGLYYDSLSSKYTRPSYSTYSLQGIEIILAKNEQVKRCVIKAKSFISPMQLAMSKDDSASAYGTDKVYEGGTFVAVLYVVLANGTYVEKEIQITNDEVTTEISLEWFNGGKDQVRYVRLRYKDNQESSVSFNGASASNPYIDIHLTLELETYYYTLWDILEEIRVADNVLYKFNTNTSSFASGIYMPIGDLKTKLQNIVAPEISIVQSTTYQAIDEIAKILDGVWQVNPSTNCLEILYLNDNTNESFENQIADYGSKQDDENFANNMLCYYGNGRTNDENIKWKPSKTQFENLSGKSLGTFTNTDMFINLDGSIENIIKVEVLINGSATTSYGLSRTITFSNYILDITPFVLSDDEYSLVDYISSIPSFDYLYPTSYNAVSYTSGSNNIHLVNKSSNIWGINYITLKYAIRSALAKKWGMNTSGGAQGWGLNLTNIDDSNFLDLKVRVAYRTPIEGRLKIESKEEKFNGDILVNQNSSQPSMDLLGNNMFGLSLKLGQPQRAVLKKFETLSERTQKGEILEDEDTTWRADTIQTTIYNDYVESNITFVKNFNQLSRRIEVNQQKRFWEISKEITSEETICEHLAFCLKDYTTTFPSNLKAYTQVSDSGTIAYGGTCLTKDFASMFAWNFVNNNFVDHETELPTYNEYLKIESAIMSNNDTNYYFPLNAFGTANTIDFKMTYSHPIMCGYARKTDPLRNEVVSYTDNNGFLDTCNITLYTMQSDSNYTINTPIIDMSSTSKKIYATIPEYQVHKRPNEIMALNFQVSFLPEKKYINTIFFGSALSVRNTLLLGRSKRLVVYYDTEKYSNYDKKGKGTLIENPRIVIEKLSTNTNVYSVYCPTLPLLHYQSWAICEENGDIVIAINDNGNGFQFYPTGKDRPN